MNNVPELIARQCPEIFQSQPLIDMIPAHIYCKNKDGIYLWCNDVQARTLGLSSGKDFFGKTDLDFIDWWGGYRFVEKILKNDVHVFNSGQQEIIEEAAVINGKHMTGLSQKSPFRDAEGNIIGIFGITINIVEKCNLSYNKEKNNIPQTYNNQSKVILTHKDTGAYVCLPLYLKICLLQILQGKTARQIGGNLSLSSRTVEHYTAKLKTLLGCASSKELIYFYATQMPALQTGFLSCE